MLVTVISKVVEAGQLLSATKLIVAIPADIPVTTPVADTVATPSLSLVQVPDVEAFKIVVDPKHIISLPELLIVGLLLSSKETVDIATSHESSGHLAIRS